MSQDIDEAIVAAIRQNKPIQLQVELDDGTVAWAVVYPEQRRCVLQDNPEVGIQTYPPEDAN